MTVLRATRIFLNLSQVKYYCRALSRLGISANADHRLLSRLSRRAASKVIQTRQSSLIVKFRRMLKEFLEEEADIDTEENEEVGTDDEEDEGMEIYFFLLDLIFLGNICLCFPYYPPQMQARRMTSTSVATLGVSPSPSLPRIPCSATLKVRLSPRKLWRQFLENIFFATSVKFFFHLANN